MPRFEVQLRAVALWDEAWCVRLNRASGVRWVRALFRAMSRLGDGVFWYVLMGGILLADGPAAAGPVLRMAAVGAIGLLLYKWLKKRTSRPRPYQVRAAIRLGADPLDQFSFPSGHMLHAVTFSILMTAHLPALAWLVWPFALLVAASRVVLGLHYPTDVLAGAAIGATLALAALALGTA
jgi:undecaprenyl-diphosphatase